MTEKFIAHRCEKCENLCEERYMWIGPIKRVCHEMHPDGEGGTRYGEVEEIKVCPKGYKR